MIISHILICSRINSVLRPIPANYARKLCPNHDVILKTRSSWHIASIEKNRATNTQKTCTENLSDTWFLRYARSTWTDRQTYWLQYLAPIWDENKGW